MKNSTRTNVGNELRDFADRDLLFSRIIDRKADAADWQRFDRLEGMEPEIAGEVVRFLRADALLGLSLDQELTRAGSQPLPFAKDASANPSSSVPKSRAAAIAAWSGWLAAAVLAFAFFGTHFAGESKQKSSPSVIATSDHELAVAAPEVEEPDASTHVLEELPLVFLSTRPAEDGTGYEVTVLRQVVESRRVEKLLGVARDEVGRPLPVPIDPAAITPPAVL